MFMEGFIKGCFLRLLALGFAFEVGIMGLIFCCGISVA